MAWIRRLGSLGPVARPALALNRGRARNTPRESRDEGLYRRRGSRAFRRVFLGRDSTDRDALRSSSGLADGRSGRCGARVVLCNHREALTALRLASTKASTLVAYHQGAPTCAQ